MKRTNSDMQRLGVAAGYESSEAPDLISLFDDPSEPPSLMTSFSKRKTSSQGHDEKDTEAYSLQVPIPQKRRVPEAIPGLMTYKTVRGAAVKERPNVGQLLFGLDALEDVVKGDQGIDDDDDEETKEKKKEEDGQIPVQSKRNFGMWDGVFARCLLNIFGVIMFLRLGYIIGLSGIVEGCFIMFISIVITFATTLSLSAICTNGEVEGGGAYFMISRALGPSFGGAIGILFAMANAVSVAMYILGFAESLVNGPFKDSGVQIVDGAMGDQIVVSLITLATILIMCIIGVGWVIKIQLILLVVLVICILFVVIGIFIVDPNPSLGVTGVSSNTTNSNLWSNYALDSKAESGGFFYAFSIFFPAVTGIMAGANISGEIKNAEYAIPWGTLLSVAISGVVYILLGILLGTAIDRETLVSNSLIMAKISVWEPAILAGIFAATLSSAIASFVGAPRILQAIAKDKIFPSAIDFFSPECRNEPVRGYFLTFIIAAVCILGGNLDAIAPLISGFFMISYAFVNFSCFLASYANLPGWRPSFIYYNKWVALITTVICMIVLFLLDPAMGAVTMILGVGIYKYIEYKDPPVSWGSAVEAAKYKMAIRNTDRLERVRDHVKNYKPQFLVLAGDMSEGAQSKRLELILFSQQLRKGKGAYIYANIINTSQLENIKHPEMRKAQKKYLRAKLNSPLKELGIPIKNGFAETIIADDLRSGVRGLLQVSGFSKIRPNILMMGYKPLWMEEPREKVDEYVNIIRDAFFYNYGVCVVRDYKTINQGITETNKSHTGTIDVWWLWDDGGLTALLPHLLHLHKVWKETELRIFVLCGDENEGLARIGEMHGLLKRLRIDAKTDTAFLPVNDKGEVTEPIQSKFTDKYFSLKKEKDGTKPGKIPARVQRHLKVSELIHEKSSNAKLVMITMPVPEVSLDSLEYLSWLECISFDLPPVCLLRGNQETVITFEL